MHYNAIQNDTIHKQHDSMQGHRQIHCSERGQQAYRFEFHFCLKACLSSEQIKKPCHLLKESSRRSGGEEIEYDITGGGGGVVAEQGWWKDGRTGVVEGWQNRGGGRMAEQGWWHRKGRLKKNCLS